MIRMVRVRGRVIDFDGRPVAGAVVHVKNCLTEGDGRFEFCTLAGSKPPEFVVRAEGFAPARYTHTKTVRPGDAVDGIVVRLRRGGTVTGRVVTGRGEAPSTYHVWLRPERGGPPEPEGVRPAEDGTFRFENVAEGRYTPRVRCRRMGLRMTGETFSVKQDATVTLPDFLLEDQKGDVLAGHVVDGRGRGIQGATVSLWSTGARRRPLKSTVTDASGAFRLDGLSPGPCETIVTRASFQRYRSIGEPGNSACRIELRPNSAIRGHVLHAGSGEPATAFRIAVYPKDAADFTRTFLDHEGRFTLPGLGDDVYELEVTSREGAISAKPVRVTISGGKDPAAVTIFLNPTAAIEGVVRGPDGSPLAKARVALVARDGKDATVRQSAATDVDGRFRIEHAQPGQYYARVTHLDWIEVLQPVTLVACETANLELALSRTGGTVRVIVRDTEGNPVAGARITVHRLNGHLLHPNRTRYDAEFLERKKRMPEIRYRDFYRAYTETDPGGEMRRTFLPSGRFKVKATCSGYLPAEAPVETQAGVETTVGLTLVKVKAKVKKKE